jgi:hypothetical protein
MIGILAEDRSDAEALKVIVRRLSSKSNLRVVAKGFGGCGELCRKAGAFLNDFAAQGIEKVIICHDADGPDAAPVEAKVRAILREKGISLDASKKIIIPVQELEAWIMADETAIATVIPTFKLNAVSQPEMRASPKEWLVRESMRGRSRPLYIPTAHNHRVAAHLDFQKVSTKCPSFAPLRKFVL